MSEPKVEAMDFSVDGDWGKKEEDFKKSVKGSGDLKPFRFYLKPDQEAKLTFIQSSKKPPARYEHMCFTNDKPYPEFIVCPRAGGKNMVECPLCEVGNYPKFARGLGALQHEYVDKNGKVIENLRRCVIVGKNDEARIKRIVKKAKGELKGRTYSVSNLSSKTCLGDTWDDEGKEDLKAMEKAGINITPLSEDEMFTVKSFDEMVIIANNLKYKNEYKGDHYINYKPSVSKIAQPTDVDPNSGEDLKDDDIPF